jgi:putative hemolysin
MRREEDGSVVARGDVPIREINRELDIELPEPAGVTTIGGLCTNLAGGIPNRNARLAAEQGVILVVLDATPRSVRRVRIIPPPKPESEDEESKTEDG